MIRGPSPYPYPGRGRPFTFTVIGWKPNNSASSRLIVSDRGRGGVNQTRSAIVGTSRTGYGTLTTALPTPTSPDRDQPAGHAPTVRAKATVQSSIASGAGVCPWFTSRLVAT